MLYWFRCHFCGMKWNVLSRLNHYGFLLSYLFTTRFCHQASSIFCTVFSLKIYYFTTQCHISQNRTGKSRSENLGRINNRQLMFFMYSLCFLVWGFGVLFFHLKNYRMNHYCVFCGREEGKAWQTWSLLGLSWGGQLCPAPFSWHMWQACCWLSSHLFCISLWARLL